MDNKPNYGDISSSVGALAMKRLLKYASPEFIERRFGIKRIPKKRWHVRLWNWICRKNDEFYEAIEQRPSERGKPIKFRRYDRLPPFGGPLPYKEYIFPSSQLDDEIKSKSDSKCLNKKMHEFYEAVGIHLKKFIADMPIEDIRNRCKRISSIDSPYIEQWYLDDQLLFETEIKHIDNVLKWEIRKPKEVRNEQRI